MMRSMFAGVSGLRAHQVMIDVVGNNIANVNTTGFRGSRTSFADTLSQTMRAGAGPMGGNGGIDPMQVGLGVRVAGISLTETQGSLQTTGRSTDLAIQGEGFFTMRQGEEVVYTRAGAMSVDAEGKLVGPTGAVLQGWAADGGGALQDGITDLTLPMDAEPALRAYAISDDGTISGTFADGSERVLGVVALATFANPGGLAKVGDTHFTETGASGGPVLSAARDGAAGSISAGTLEMSNVELAEEFSNLILAQRGFQATSRIITATDEVLQDLVNLKR